MPSCRALLLYPYLPNLPRIRYLPVHTDSTMWLSHIRLCNFDITTTTPSQGMRISLLMVEHVLYRDSKVRLCQQKVPMSPYLGFGTVFIFAQDPTRVNVSL